MSPPHFVISGTGRCGTAYAAEVFQSCAVNCGHQKVLTHRQSLGASYEWGHYHGDSSYEAVPILDRVKALKVVIVREPLAVMRSWRGLGLFVDRFDMWEKWGLLSRVLDRYFPEVMACEDPMGQAALYWYYWTKVAVSRADVTLKLSSINPQLLFDVVERSNQYRTCAEDVPRDTNSRAAEKKDRGPHSWDEVPVYAAEACLELATRLGLSA